MEASITSRRTEDQERQTERMMEDLIRSAAKLAMKKVDPDKDGLQQLHGRGPEIGSELNDFMIEQVRKHATSNQFADEEAESTYKYPDEYKGAKSIVAQIMAIAEICELDPTHALDYAKNLPELPEGAEAWFAVPTPGAIAAKHFPEVTDPAEQYCRAIQFMHAKIKDSRAFYNYRDGQITPAQLRLSARTAHALAEIMKTQTGDIIIVAAQLGMRHRGRSVRRAREVFMTNEYGLGSLMVGSIALTHPERFVRSAELDMDCPGDEFSEGDGVFGKAPDFGFRDDEVEFDTYDVGHADEYYGSASGFLPQ